jgi:hypothetical protein
VKVVYDKNVYLEMTLLKSNVWQSLYDISKVAMVIPAFYNVK